jgi:hypothetical protein
MLVIYVIAVQQKIAIGEVSAHVYHKSVNEPHKLSGAATVIHPKYTQNVNGISHLTSNDSLCSQFSCWIFLTIIHNVTRITTINTKLTHTNHSIVEKQYRNAFAIKFIKTNGLILSMIG